MVPVSWMLVYVIRSFQGGWLVNKEKKLFVVVFCDGTSDLGRC